MNIMFLYRALLSARGVVCLFFLVISTQAWTAGFIEMPDVEEVPEYENDSMLLDLDVPNVRERDPDPEAGPRLNVKEFRLQGIVEYPELGINRAELIQRVEAIRFDLMEEGDLTDSGYTLGELGELSDLIADIEKDTDTEHVGSLEVQKLVFLIRDQRRKRGITLGMIETVADTITLYYRQKGFILAKAYIPKQRVRDGVVTLTLLLGELGEISVSNNNRLSENHVKNVFKSRINQPVTDANIEESLYLLNDTPGISAQGFFEPGSQVGDTKLNVNVLSEKWYSANVRVDNHGSDATSENRIYADFFIHNPLGWGDQIYLSVLNSFSPNNSTYGAIRYNTFFFNPRLRLSLGVSTNDFISRDVRVNGDPIFTGESQVADISFQYFFKRNRVKNYSVNVDYVSISTDLDAIVETTQDSDQVSLKFNFDTLDQRSKKIYLGNVSLTQAENSVSGGGLANGGDTSEAIFKFEATRLSFPKFPFTNYNTRLILKSAGQYAGESLINLNQMSLTGPQRTRAFSINGLQVDDGLYLGADWVFSLPTGDRKIFGQNISRLVQPFVFADASYGVLQEFSDVFGSTVSGGNNTSIDGSLAGAGIGIKFKHSRLSGSLIYSVPISDDFKEFQEETPRTDFLIDLQYSFN